MIQKPLCKKLKRLRNTQFPGIDAKTALQNGRLFLYQSLYFDLSRGNKKDTSVKC